jgi:hypothetical protein
MVFFKPQEIIVQALRTVIISAAVLAAAGIAGSAVAQTKSRQSADSHVLTVRLPDGSLERIRYTGNQPPEINFEGRPTPVHAFVPLFDGFDSSSPFADLDRISAMMDQEAAAMLQEAGNIERWAPGKPDDMMKVDFGKLPPGTQGYSVVSTMSGNQVCTRSVRYFSSGNGKPPRVETSSSGNCDASRNKDPQPLHALSPRPIVVPRQSHLIEANYHPDAGAANARSAPFRIASSAGE